MKRMDWREFPVFIVNRNRLSSTKRLVEWLLEAETRHITILDNDSTYGPLLDWYMDEMPKEVKFMEMKQNAGPWVFWHRQMHQGIQSNYIVTDSDLVPADICPKDIVLRMKEVLDHNSRQKVGPSLRLDNLPDTPWKHQVIESQKQYWVNKVGGLCWDAPIDTTFAMYRPGGWVESLWGHSLRMDAPYVFEHTPWYTWPFDEEEKFYRQTTSKISSVIDQEPYFRFVDIIE